MSILGLTVKQVQEHTNMHAHGSELFTAVSLLGQCLLLVDSYVEEHRLDSQQHPALDLSRQSVKHGSRQGHQNVDTISVACDGGQHVRGRASRGLSNLGVRQKFGLVNTMNE